MPQVEGFDVPELVFRFQAAYRGIEADFFPRRDEPGWVPDLPVTPRELEVPAAPASRLWQPLASLVAFESDGSGDVWGVWWPDGASETDPVVLYTAHHAHGFVPEASSVRAFLRIRRAMAVRWRQRGDVELLDRVLDEPPPPDGPADEDDLALVARVDPDSPKGLLAEGHRSRRAADLDAAETSFRRALDVVPHFTAAWAGLAAVLRMARRPDDATVAMLETMASPLDLDCGTFWGVRAPDEVAVRPHPRVAEWLGRAREPAALPPRLAAVWTLREALGAATRPPYPSAGHRLLVDRHLREGDVAAAIQAHRTWAVLRGFEPDPARERMWEERADLYDAMGDGLRAAYLRRQARGIRLS